MTTATSKPGLRRRPPAGRAARGVTRRQIQEVVDQIARKFKPRQVILFGSRARGTAHPDSDVDVLVVTDKPARPGATLRIRMAIEYRCAPDLIVSGQRRLEKRIAAGDFFLQDAVQEGKVLYDRARRPMA